MLLCLSPWDRQLRPPPTVGCKRDAHRWGTILLSASVILARVAISGPAPVAAQSFVSYTSGTQDGGWNIGERHDGTRSYAVWGTDAPIVALWYETGYSSLLQGALMHFSLTGAPQGVVSARLYFYASFGYRAIDLYHIDGLVESNIGTSELALPLGWVGGIHQDQGEPPHSPGMWLDLDVTSTVQQDLDCGRAFSAYMFWGAGADIYLSESGQYAPRLTLMPIPEPSSLAALLLGLGGYTGWRRKGRWRT